MLHVITSNRLDFSSVKEEIDNFFVVHSYNRRVKNTKIHMEEFSEEIFYDIYHQNGTDVSDEIEAYSSTIKISEISCESFKDALDKIKRKIEKIECEEEDFSEEEDLDSYEAKIVLASDDVFSRLVKQYLDKRFRQSQVQISEYLECFNLIEYLKASDIKQLASQLKMNLGIEFVYEDDPVAFSFVVRQMFQ